MYSQSSDCNTLSIAPRCFTWHLSLLP